MKVFSDKIKKTINIPRDSWKDYPFFASVCVFFLIFLFYLSSYLNSPGISYLDDHFFHFKYAYLIRTQGWEVVKNFNWIAVEPGRSGVYHLTLYNLALIPFTYIKDMVIGLKISDIFWASLSISSIYYAFRKFKITYPLFWIFVLMSIPSFAIRMLIGRALVLVPAFLMLEFYFAKEKKYGKLFLISLLHVAWHTSTFFFPLVITILIEVSRVLVGRKFFWKNIVAAIVGIFVGLKLTLYKMHGLFQGVLGVQFSTMQSVKNSSAKIEGNELYPADIFKIMKVSEIFLMFLLIGFSIVIYYYIDSKKKENTQADKENNFILYSAFLFVLMSFSGTMLVSGRFYDFYFVSVVFLVAVIVAILIKNKMIVIETSLKKYILFGVIIFFAFANVRSFLDIKESIAKTDYRPAGEIANWIEDESSENERVFLSDWSSFPVAFFYNSKNVYNIGIEPRGALMANPSLYWKWYNMFVYGFYCDQQEDCFFQKKLFDEKISQVGDEQKKELKRESSKKIIESIKNDFGARYVIAGNNFASIIELNPELIDDSYIAKSEYNGGIIKGFQLK
ncbi:MAG: hypothetical protein C0412_07760 [Flavobacterium sp.]|nr:hypothetical protein [Flavobacterium sp.]